MLLRLHTRIPSFRPPFGGQRLLAASFVIACLLSICTPRPATTQATDTLRENPNIHLLRHIWRVNGENEQDRVGIGMGSVGDVDGNGITDIAYHTGRSARWDVHLGDVPAPLEGSLWSAGNAYRPYVKYPVVAEFIPGRMTVGFPIARSIDTNLGVGLLLVPSLRFFDTANGNLQDTVFSVWDPHFANETKIGYFINQFLADDLDRIPGDEFVVVTPTRRNYAVDEWGNDVDRWGTIKPEIWIYRGGAGFQLDTPTVMIPITDTLDDEGFFHALISDFDGDGYPDLMSVGIYTQGTLMHLWFGDSTSPWDWTATPDRTIDVTSVGLRSEVTHGDYDGDGLLDFAGTVLRDERFTTNLFLSAGGKSIRDRSFSEADVDRAIFTDVFQTVAGPAPYLSDSAHRYAMLALRGPSRFAKGSDMLYFLSGGPHGPNATADAFWAPSRDGIASGPVLSNAIAIPDCNGDGFDDFMVGDSKWWYNLFDYGIALVLAGTDSIPNDDPTVGVRSTATGSSAERLVIYPNPVRSHAVVEIPGSLRHRKGALTILNVRGELIRRLDVPAGTDRLSLDVADLSEGIYLVRLSEEGSNETLEGLMIREASGE